MIAWPLQSVIFVSLLVIAGAVFAAVVVDRRRFRDPLLVRAGAEPALLGQRFESAPFGLLLLDQQMQALYANAYARRLLLPDPSLNLVNSSFGHIELPSDLTAVQPGDQQRPVHRVLTLPSGQTTSWWLCPLPHSSLLFVTDLTQQRRLQKASQAFLSTLSHELRTPLTAVLAHLDIVQKQDVDETTRQSSLAIVHQELRRLARLVQDMLQLGRLEMGDSVEKKPLDIFLIVEAAVAQIILMAEARDITLSLEATAGLPQIFGDADKLKQVFLNVLDNSIKYCRPRDRIRVYLRPEADGVLVVFQDTGPGISSSHVSRVIERFHRVHEDSTGSGLGLAIAAEALRLHGTRLKIESPGDEETGVKVSFLLPVSEPESSDVTL